MENATKILTQLLNLLHVQFSQSDMQDVIEKHPYFPSLLSISDILRDFGVDNVGYNAPNKEVWNIETPFIAHIINDKFIIVKEITDEHVIVLDKNNDPKRVEKMDFKRSFTGNFLKINEITTIENSTNLKRNIERFLSYIRIPLIITGTLVVLLLCLYYLSNYFSGIKLQSIFLSLFLFLGFITSIVLLIQSIDSNNPIVLRLCKTAKSNCTSILGSKSAKLLWGYLSWAEAGYFYFSGSLLVLIFNSTNVAILQFLAIINLLSLPYTFYSIFYQKLVAKQWCALCCTIQIIFWLEFFMLFKFLYPPLSQFTIEDGVKILTSFLVPMLLWGFTKPFFSQSQQIKPLREQLNLFKNNAQVFEAIVKEKGKYPLLNDEYSLISGDTAFKDIITIVTNPACGVCKQAQETLELWLLKYGGFRLQIVFAIDDFNMSSITESARRAYSQHFDRKKSITVDAFPVWKTQESKNFENWTLSYLINEETKVNEILAKNGEWCKMINVEYTPTILINGYKIPPFYILSEIKYFLINNRIV